MKYSSAWFYTAVLAIGIPHVVSAQTPAKPCWAPFGGPGLCVGLFPHIHQHGPLYNYGPYYGYPPFEPYGPWTAQLRYNPTYGDPHYGGRIAEDKSGHGGLLTQWGGLGLGGGGLIGDRLLGGRESGCGSAGLLRGVVRIGRNGACSNCAAAPASTMPPTDNTKK